MRSILQVCVLSLLAWDCAGTHSAHVAVSPVAVISTTECQVVAAPQEFDEKVVEFTADFESDGIEHSVLVDPSCTSRGIVPYFDATLPAAEREQFEHAIYSGRPGTVDKQIRATFTGTFKWDAARADYTEGAIARSIKLFGISGITVVPRKPAAN